ncbi:39S ribosomal protein L45 [Cucumis melo var. makuwa]|uniref:39S ribosomal protein L45 n=1 Tax=Cucumis melo var. makuwa TaxID=1194695 RepID=A0A5D3CJ04_CUCMM|nr:39S ribosomal protein L45 [Cucumis melo var. makuwa]
MNFITLRSLQTLYRTPKIRPFTSPIGSSANYSCGITNVSQLGIQKTSSFLSNSHSAFSLARGHKMIVCSAVAAEFSVFSHGIGVRLVTTQAKAPPQARQKVALKVSMLSPGFIYEPYSPRQQIPFWQRWFTRSGWKRTKDDIILELLQKPVKGGGLLAGVRVDSSLLWLLGTTSCASGVKQVKHHPKEKGKMSAHFFHTQKVTVWHLLSPLSKSTNSNLGCWCNDEPIVQPPPLFSRKQF